MWDLPKEVKYLEVVYLLGPETTTREFEEFRFTCTSTAIVQVSNGLWHELACQTPDIPDRYLKKYFLKYSSGFANTDLECGDMYVGVTDSGEALGIPCTSTEDVHKTLRIFQEKLFQLSPNIFL